MVLRAADVWPLVGRDREVAEVCAAFRAGRSVVVVTGEAGIGKTRLARECLGRLAEEGTATAWAVAGAAAQSISLGALAPWLGTGTGPGLHSASDTAVLLQSTLGSGRTVLAVDDAQWLDEASASVIVELAGTGRPALLLTVRSDEEQPPSLKALLSRDPVATVALRPLVEGDVRQVVPEILAGPVESASAYRLWRRSEGNPLWLRELVLDALGSGRLASRDGLWHWDDAAAGGPGPRLLDLLRDRLSAGDGVTARWLDLIALSEPLPMALATTVMGADAVEDLVDAGLVVLDPAPPPGSLRFAHPLYGELLRDAVPPLRARNLWAALVQAQEDRPDPAVEVRRQAAWRLEAGLTLSPVLAAAAAHDALDHADPELANRLADGVAAGAAPPGVLEDLAVARVGALGSLGRWEEVLEAVGQLDLAGLDGNQQARLAAVRLWPQLFMGDLAAADQFLAAAEAEATTPDLRHAAATHRATVALFRGDVDDCRRIARGLLARTGLDDFSRRWSVRSAVSADALRGTGHEGATTAEAELTRPGAGLDLSLAVVELAVGYCLALWRTGRLHRALEVAEEYHEWALRLRDPNRTAVSLMLVGIAQLELGRVAEAEGHLAEACRAMGRDQPLFFLPFAFAELARARAVLGDADGAARALDEVDQAFFQPLPVFTSALDRGRGWVLAALGRPADAADRMGAAAVAVGRQGQLAQQAVLLHDVVRLGRPGLVAAALAELAAACDGELVAVYAAHAAAAAAGDGGRLESVAADAARLGDVLLAADCWAEAAVTHRAAGRHRAADRCGSLARRQVRSSGPVRSPALDRLAWQAAPLTPREAQVATLARQGLSNREIAVRTGCSVRTVENHLGRVYAKLGVAGRGDLPAGGDA